MGSILTLTGAGNAGSSPSLVGLKAWYKPDAELLAVGDGNPVDVWADASGNGNDVEQLTGSKRPTFIASSTINSGPAVRFNTTVDTYLEQGFPSGFGSETGQTLLIVFRLTSDVSNATLLTTAVGSEFYGTLNGADSQFEYRNPIAAVTLSGLAPKGPFLGVATFSDSGNSTHLELVGTASTTDADFGTLTTTLIGIGAANASATATFVGDIAEILIYDRDITGPGLDQSKAYLQRGYGV